MTEIKGVNQNTDYRKRARFFNERYGAMVVRIASSDELHAILDRVIDARRVRECPQGQDD